jgi:hypothetical protein
MAGTHDSAPAPRAATPLASGEDLVLRLCSGGGGGQSRHEQFRWRGNLPPSGRNGLRRTVWRRPAAAPLDSFQPPAESWMGGTGRAVGGDWGVGVTARFLFAVSFWYSPHTFRRFSQFLSIFSAEAVERQDVPTDTASRQLI